MDIVNKNTGVLLTVPQPGDFVAGISSPIVFEARNQLANWVGFESTQQHQSDSVFDTSGCVSYSDVLGCIAPQLNWMLANNLLPKSTVEWANRKGYIVNGKFELSVRAIVVWSKTTPQGNTGQNVIQTVRMMGIPSAKTWPNLLNDNASVSRETYFIEPSAEAVAEAAEFKNYFKFLWEFFTPTPALIQKYLQQSPLQIYTPVCAGWGTVPVVPKCDQPIQHATAIHALDQGKYVIEDQYPPFQKELASDYIAPNNSIMRIIAYPIPQAGEPLPATTPQAPQFQFGRDLVFGERSQDVLHLQTVLGIEITGVYDGNTASAVFRYQLSNLSSLFLEMILTLKGRRVGPRTRAVLNKPVSISAGGTTMNPGYKTTEFWVTTVTSLLGIFASIGVIAPDQANTVSTAVGQIVGGVVAIASVIQYLRSRTALKVAGIQAGVIK